MVWSDSVGTSIIIPSDRVAGDGRNYFVIGENVPPAITDNFTAAIVVRNGVYGDTADPSVGNGVSTGGPIESLYPAGFFFWAIGITATGYFEIVTYYVVFPSPRSDSYTTYRRTIFSVRIIPVIGTDGIPYNAHPFITIGNGTYSEGDVEVGSIAEGEPGRYPNVANIGDGSAGSYGLTKWWYGADGFVTVNGAVVWNGPAISSGTINLFQIDPHYAPTSQIIGVAKTFNGTRRVQIYPSGIVMWVSESDVLGTSAYLTFQFRYRPSLA